MPLSPAGVLAGAWAELGKNKYYTAEWCMGEGVFIFMIQQEASNITSISSDYEITKVRFKN